MKVCYSHRGAISVFLTLILLPTLVFGGLVTDAARIYGSESLISEAGELAMNAGLSQYDRELKDDYGLMVMERTPEEMSDDLEQYFINTIRASNLEGAEDVASLIDLKCDSFSAYNVEGSQIYRTEAEKQQILEYMKYRAPVCLGEDLWDTLNQIKDAKKQVEAMEAQMDFAESMENLQEACENADKALEKYCRDAEENPVITSTTVNSAINTARSCYEDATVYLFMLDTIWRYPSQGTRESSAEYLDTMALFNSYADSLSQYSGDTLKDYFSTYLTCLYYQLGIPDDVSAFVDAKVEAAGSTAEKLAIMECYNKYIQYKQGVMVSYVTALENKAAERFREGQGYIAYWYTAIATAEDDAQTALEKLDTLKEKISEQKTKYTNWTGKISNLDAGDLRTNMENDAQGYENLLDEGALETLYTHLSENKENLGRALEHLRQTTFCGISLAEPVSDAAITVFKNEVSNWNCFPVSMTDAANEAASWAASLTSAKFEASEIPDSEGLFSVKEDPFYRELQEKCEAEAETEESQEDKNKTKSLLNQAHIETSGTGIAGLTDPDWSGKPLPSVVLSQLGGDGEDNDKYVMSGADVDRNGRREAIANAKNSMSGMASFLDDLQRILEDGIENIYIMEYGIQMFSYYTVDKDENGNTITGEITSISDDDLTDNAMYKSEVEYMLWGNQDVKKNVNNTRLLLYGIRMIFNMIYSFSDNDIAVLSKGMATAMSCGVAFLIPVFTVVIKIAIAGAETASDVENLMAGKKVPFIKNARNSQIRAELGLSSPGGTDGSLELRYKDYLSIFLLIRTFGSSEAKTLARIADCIQLNVDKDIINGYTMLSVRADVESRTTFMKKAAQLPDGGNGSIVNDWYTISYQSVLGY